MNPTTRGFVHGDCRLDNWFFYVDKVDGCKKAGLLDWQVCSLGSVLVDLALLLTGSCSSEFIDQHMDFILRVYLDKLCCERPDLSIDKELWEEEFSLACCGIVVRYVTELN